MSDERDALAAANEERRLVERARQGDGAAFSALVTPHLAMLFRVAGRSCRSRELAEDAVQDALTIAAGRLESYEPGTSLKAWLAAITSQRAWTLLRGELRRRQREQAASEPQRAASPEQHLRARQAADRVQAALAKLPEKRRQAAMLRLDGGLSYKEIAQELETSAASARVLVHLSVKALRAELGDLLEGEG
ncbi:MAG: sigma-70 family RNA polymerase sigma factor [Myxococcales bacterium]|nr:sigma-70 family RNA polymerase sigma factor [Myxococcales bacterium]